MKQRYLLTAAMAACLSLTAMAVPAKPGQRVFTQPDGTRITLSLVGDEHFHTYVSADGRNMRRGADGFFREVADADVAQMRERAGVRRARRQAPARKSQVPCTGSPRIPVLLVQYSDYSFKDADPLATFRSFFVDGDKSATRYFVDQSNGKYTPQFDVYGPVTLSGTRADYGGNDAWGNDIGCGNMVGEAVQALDDGIDYSLYDNDGDGECDVVIVIYAGDAEASSYHPDAANAIWPCQWALSYSEFGRPLTPDGTKVDRFAVFNELNGSDMSRIDGVGTFCHEYSHCLDLPDFYDTKYSGYFGMSHWSLLDYGCYNDDGYTPVGYSAYEKAFMGWIEIGEAEDNMHYTLPVLNQKNADTDLAVRITNPLDPDEYYVIENRARTGWDAFLPAEGLLITHVTYDEAAWTNNTVNNYSKQRMTPIPADNELKMTRIETSGGFYFDRDEESLKGDLWPWQGVDELTDFSTPAAKVYTGRRMGRPVTEITRNDDGTISFWVTKPMAETPSALSHSIESESSLALAWQPAGDVPVTYTVEVAPHREINYHFVSDTQFSTADHGWLTVGFTELVPTSGVLRIGSERQAGGVVSPSFRTGGDGLVTVFLDAASYPMDNTAITISLLDRKGNRMASRTQQLVTRFDRYAVVLEGDAEVVASVRIETETPDQVFYLRQVVIYTGDATGLDLLDVFEGVINAPCLYGEPDGGYIYRAEAAAEGYDSLSRTAEAPETVILTGIEDTRCVVEGLVPGAVYDCRVRAVPVDATDLGASAWSETLTVDMSAYDPNSVETIGVDPEDSGAAVYYDLQGRRVRPGNLAPGLYIKDKRLVIKD